ncbi:uncharacterized protein LOC110934059 [Helianthus annuus]|uniref:uncharacterized protein LOC110934059 n=1 Tax=Helianthus annuus TaxID=4232 RepID=UPI000B8F8616|nr:uncharacterized protein LOC110934059 [Helianthus annuus]
MTTTRGQTEIEKTLKEHANSLLKIDAFMAKTEHTFNDFKQLLEKLVNNNNNNHFGSSNTDNTNQDFNNFNRNDRFFRMGKLEFPKYDGSGDVEDWVCKCEHFFDVDDTPENYKVRYAVIHLEGRTIKWHNNFAKTRPIASVSWAEYARTITDRFSKQLFRDAMGILSSTVQDGELETYCDEFDENLLRVTIAEEYAISLFIKGLKPELGGPVSMFDPKTMKEAYMLAKKQKLANDKMKSQFKPSFNSKPTSSTFIHNPKPISTFKPPVNTSHLPLLPNPHPNQKLSATRRLTSREIENKRSKGECFWCNDKLTPTHKCPNKQLFVLEVVDGEDEGQQDGEYMTNDPTADVTQDTVIDTTVTDPLISIHALTGIPSFSTMQVVGNIGTKTLQILIDSGSTHNFIDEKLAVKLGCVMKDIEGMKVGVANGSQLLCVKVCPGFQWQMQGLWMKADVLVLPLASYDMVLGVQWLSSLGDIVWNFQDLTMQFRVDSKVYQLKGSNTNRVSLCSNKLMSHLLTSQCSQVVQSQLFSLQQVEGDEHYQHKAVVSNGVADSKIQSLLQEFGDVFATPSCLPPSRAYDHKIILKDESMVISQKPYRYQAAQKDVIEKVTKELLDTGVIQGSTSPFAAPVVLVKKKTDLGECVLIIEGLMMQPLRMGTLYL